MARQNCCLSEAEPLLRGGSLDCLRFLASLFIVGVHFNVHTPSWASSALGRGYLATDFFLLLSGFVLARVYGTRLSDSRVSAGHFFIRRVARIWPAHIIMLVLCGISVMAAAAAGVQLNHPESFQWKSWPAHALLIQSWGLGVSSGSGWTYQSWTLSALVICYACFPAFWRLLKPISPAWSVGIVVVSLALAERAAWFFGKDLFALPPAIGVLRALPIFLFGVAIARLSHLELIRSRLASVAAWSAPVVLVALQMAGRFDLLSILLIGLVVLVAGTHAPRGASKPWARAADVSFSLYITHTLVGPIWFRMLAAVRGEPDGAMSTWAGWIGGIVFCVFAAAVFHYFVDAPIQRWLRPRLDRLLATKPSASLEGRDYRRRDPSSSSRHYAKMGPWGGMAARISRPQVMQK